MLDFKRRFHSLIYMCLPSSMARGNYVRKHHLFGAVGKDVRLPSGHIPARAENVFLHNNIEIAAGAKLVPHDAIHHMLNYYVKDGSFQENIGCIDIKDNVFIGSNTTILPDVMIGPNTIIAAGSLVNKSIPGNGVYGGVPVNYICSMDDFIEKRKNVLKITISRGKGGLSDTTIEALLNRFKEGEKYEQ